MKGEKLEKIGLTKYERRSYRALLKLGPSKGKEVAKEAEIPKTRAYDVLRNLVEKGLADVVQEKPLVFKPIEPEVGLKSLFDRKIEEIENAKEKVIKSLKEIETKTRGEEKVEEKVTSILGYEKMYSLFTNWVREANKEILIFSVGEEVPYQLRVATKKAGKRGVDLRLITTQYKEKNIPALKSHSSDGYKVKHYPSTGEWTFGIIDKKKVMINVREEEAKGERISIFFEVPGMAKALAEYYEKLWKESKDVDL